MIWSQSTTNENKKKLDAMSPPFSGGFFYNGSDAVKLILLSEKFYMDFAECKEILSKDSRPYILVVVEICGKTFAIPFRSHINHENAYITSSTQNKGIDYSKSVVINDPLYIRTDKKPQIDDDEFDILRGKEHIIRNGLIRYIKKYKRAKNYQNKLRNVLLCSLSTLQYFENDIKEI